MDEYVIVAKKLAKKYKDEFVVDHIDFSINYGECFAFLGPNGAGKTTTMKMLYGFSPITDGELTVFSLNVKTRIREIKYRMGVIPQEDNLDPDLNVLKNLIVYSRYFDIPEKVAMERAQEALELFQLWDKRNDRIRELSGGMKRRLVIARALINEPELIILDEPTTGLDPQARHLVWQKLRHLSRQGKSMILTTHYMDEASQLCSRLVIMDKGKILDIGSPQELIEKHVKKFVLEVRIKDGFKDSFIKKLPSSLMIEDVGDTIYIYTEDGDGIRRNFDMAEIDQLLQRTSNLEDVFLRLAGRALAGEG